MATVRHLELTGLSFRVMTPDQQPRALLIHDMASDADAHATAVEEQGAIVYDRRGYGGSAAPDSYVATTVEEQSEDAARLLQTLQAPPLTVIGHGFGAVIALDLAHRHPAKVAALELHNPLLPQDVSEEWLRDVHTLARGKQRPAAFFADVAALPTWQIPRRELQALVASARVSR